MSAPVQTEARSTFERVLARRTDDLSQRQAERAAELAQQGAPQRARPRRVTLARVAGVVLGLLFLRLVFGGTPRRRGNEPIGAGAVATADGAGVGSSAAAFLPQVAVKAASESAPAASAESTGALLPTASAAAASASRTTPTQSAPRSSGAPPRAPRPAPTPAGMSTALAESLPVLVATGATQAEFTVEVGLATPANSSSAPATTAVINVGTRLRAALDAPLRTGSALAPATAILADDVRDGDRVLLEAGTRLVGTAFATPHDDRVQIVWRALVHDGRTLAIRAETLGPDGAPGLAGKVIRRHRKGVLRRIGSTLAATAGDAAGYVVPLGDTALEQAGAALAGRAGRELGQLGSGSEWLQADTVVEVKAGTPVVVYVSADIVLGASGAP